MLSKGPIAALAVTAVLFAALLAASAPTEARGSGPSVGLQGVLGAVSEFRSYAWQSYPTPSGFPGLFNPSVASDPVDHELVVFGGCVQVLCTVGTNATWTESNGLWTERNPAASPPPREEAQMAWDPADGYVLLFGGTGCHDPPTCSATGPLNDTWAFKDGTWNPVVPSGPSPPPTDQGGLAYDPSSHDMVLFGGYGCSSSCETWTYSGGTWTELNLTTQPSARYGEGFAEDDSDHGALLYGGVSSTGSYLSDTWLFSGGAWHAEPSAGSPAVREDPAIAWDPGLGAVVLFGGDYITLGSLTISPSTFYNDTWEFENGTWTEWGAGVNPGFLWETGFAEDPTTGLLVLVGGCESTACPSTVPWGFGPQHPVNATLEAGMCANVTLAGAALLDGTAAALQNGTYPLHIVACTGDQFANLTTTSLLIPNSTAQNGTQWTGSILVEGAGTILVNLTRQASNPPPTGLAAISVFGLTFLELLLILVAVAAIVGVFLAVHRVSRRRSRPPGNGAPAPPHSGATSGASAPSQPPPKT